MSSAGVVKRSFRKPVHILMRWLDVMNLDWKAGMLNCNCLI